MTCIDSRDDAAFDVARKILRVLDKVPRDQRVRVLRAACVLLGFDLQVDDRC